MPKPRPPQRYRCRCCGIVLPAWYAVPGAPNGAMLLQHVSQSHPVELRPYLAQMAGGNHITAVIVQAYEVVDDTPATRPEQGTRRAGDARS
jgi:hypothetical protein